jgi:ribosomal protein S27AE
MSSDNTGFFKIKPTKRSNPEERTTLDTIHQFQVRKILNDKNEVEDIETEYNKLAEEIDATDDDLIRGQLEAKLKNLELSINEKTRDDKIDDYFLKTGPILFDYYEVQNAISKGIRGSYMKKIKGKPGDVLTALQEASKQNDISNSSATIIGFDSKSSSDEEEAPAKNESSNTLSRDTLLDKYLQKINPAYSRKNSSTLEDDLGTCPECGKDMIFAVNEAMLYCNHCNYNEFILIDSDRPSYKDPPRSI